MFFCTLWEEGYSLRAQNLRRNCKAKANRRQPAELRDGDGCLGAKCGARNATAAGRAAAMRRMCEALENGTRRLVAWPATADDTDVWIRPEEAVRAILRRMEVRTESEDSRAEGT